MRGSVPRGLHPEGSEPCGNSGAAACQVREAGRRQGLIPGLVANKKPAVKTAGFFVFGYGRCS